MSKARRRTLSHEEVENFLNEINNKTVIDSDMLSKQSSLKNINEVAAETKPVAPPDEAQMIRDYCRVKFIYDVAFPASLCSCLDHFP